MLLKKASVVGSDMADSRRKVRIENIDLVLRDAQICLAQVNILQQIWSEADVERSEERALKCGMEKITLGRQEKALKYGRQTKALECEREEKALECGREEVALECGRKEIALKCGTEEIALKCATIFRDMMVYLYSVLDQIYYFLYCHFQNNDYVSLSNDAFQIKQPITHNLKGSEDDRSDRMPDCKEKRNEWITDQCKKIFGVNCHGPENYNVGDFQKNLLRLQAIRKVDSSGKEVPEPNGVPTLLRACNIQHDPAGNGLQFSPRKVSFEELKSVRNMDDWDETTVFNLIHFFRNYTDHRSLIALSARDGYLNLKTTKSIPEPWCPSGKGFWILVPELSHLRQTKDVSDHVTPKFYPHPLTIVCNRAFTFVKDQRQNLCRGLGGEYPYDVGWNSLTGVISFKKNNKDLGQCEWERANLFAAT